MDTPDLVALRELLAKATPGPWEVDTEKSEGNYGSGPDCHSGFQVSAIIGGADGKTLFDALNSDACIVDEEGPDEDGYYYAWDTVSDTNAALIVAAVNALPKLLDRIEADAKRIAELEAENERLRKALLPEWFYLGDDQSSDQCRDCVYEVIDEDFLWDNRREGEYVVEITTALRGPTIWAHVKFFTDDEKDARQSDDDYELTEYDSEEAARAALQQKDREDG